MRSLPALPGFTTTKGRFAAPCRPRTLPCKQPFAGRASRSSCRTSRGVQVRPVRTHLPSSLPGQDRWASAPLPPPSAAALPEAQAGRLLYRPLRGCPALAARAGLRARCPLAAPLHCKLPPPRYPTTVPVAGGCNDPAWAGGPPTGPPSLHGAPSDTQSGGASSSGSRERGNRLWVHEKEERGRRADGKRKRDHGQSRSRTRRRAAAGRTQAPRNMPGPPGNGSTVAPPAGRARLSGRARCIACLDRSGGSPLGPALVNGHVESFEDQIGVKMVRHHPSRPRESGDAAAEHVGRRGQEYEP